jgi:hypothetical protein
MFWGELRVLSSSEDGPVPTLIDQKAKPSTVARACETAEAIAQRLPVTYAAGHAGGFFFGLRRTARRTSWF